MSGGSGAWQLIALREVSVKLRDKVFIGSTVFMLLFLVASVGFGTLMDARVDTVQVAVVDEEGRSLVERAQDLDEDDGGGGTVLEAVSLAGSAQAEQALVDEDAALALLPEGSGATSTSTTGWELVAVRHIDPPVADRLAEAVQVHALDGNAREAGTTTERLLSGSQLGSRLLDADAMPEEVRFAVGFVFALLFYLTALTFGLAIAQSVVEEKQSRVVEILAVAVPLRQLLIGKVVGNSGLAIAQVVLIVGLGMVSLSLTGQAEILGPVIGAGSWFIVFFLLGFGAVACVWAVAGSVATRTEDLQATTMPVTAVVMVALFAGLFAKGQLLVLASFVPLVSSVAMPIRMLGGDVPWWQPVLSGLLVLLTAVALIRLGARMYEASLLRTERRTTLREALSNGG